MELINKTICECLKEQVSKTPNKVALEYEDEMFSWKDLDLLSDRVAIVARRMGIKKGSHVGIWSVNTPNWIFTFFALTKLGAIPILINACYKEMELSRVLEYADVEFLCYGDENRDVKCKDILEKVSSKIFLDYKKCIEIGKSTNGIWKGIKADYNDISKEELDDFNFETKEISTYDTAAILFTSGTSKTPKGVMLSHYNLVNNSMEIASNMRWTSQDEMCVAVPLYHCFGVTASLLVAVHTGCTIHLLKYYRTIDVLKKIDKYKCTILNGVPSMFLAMMHNEKFKEYNLSCIKSGIIAGSNCSPIEYLKICKTFKFYHLQPSYGQTEASPCITISNYDDSVEVKSQTAGEKIQNIMLRIFDKDTNRELQTGETGEIQTSGYHVMQGYYKMPNETKEVLSENGWLLTGDLGYLDGMGYLHVTGRKTEMIIRGGENISPEEIEGCICGFPNIKNIKVVGIKADVLQEDIVACIVSIDGKTIDVQKLRDFIKGKLSNYKVPKYILQFKSLHYNASGKVILNDLKQQALNEIKELNIRRN